MTTEKPDEDPAAQPRFPDPGKPTGGRVTWVDKLFAVVITLAAVGALIAVCGLVLSGDQANSPSGKYKNGVYIPAGNLLRFNPADGTAQDPGVTAETTNTCASNNTASVRVSGFTPGGEFAVRILASNRIDIGWTGTADGTGSTGNILLNCGLFTSGHYQMTVTDITSRRATILTFVSETRRS